MHEAKRHNKQFFSVHQPLAICELYFCTHRKNNCLPNKRDVCQSVVASKNVFGTSVSNFLCVCGFSGAFAKLRKVTISFVMSVRHPLHPSVRPSRHLSARNNSAPTGRISTKFDTWLFSKKKVIEHKMYVLISSTTYIWTISRFTKNWATYDRGNILAFM